LTRRAEIDPLSLDPPSTSHCATRRSGLARALRRERPTVLLYKITVPPKSGPAARPANEGLPLLLALVRFPDRLPRAIAFVTNGFQRLIRQDKTPEVALTRRYPHM
jgi:hypothetical protein